jgi:hypothetical protein
LVGWCEWYPDAAGAGFAEAGLLESKGYCFPCQHLNYSRGASSYAFTVFYAAAGIGIPIFGIPILAIHPNWDPNFSDPDLGDELKESDN